MVIVSSVNENCEAKTIIPMNCESLHLWNWSLLCWPHQGVRWPFWKKQSKVTEELHTCNFIWGNGDKCHVFQHFFLIRLPVIHVLLRMMNIPVFWDNKTLLLTHHCFPSPRVCDSLLPKRRRKNKLLLPKSPKLCVSVSEQSGSCRKGSQKGVKTGQAGRQSRQAGRQADLQLP